MSIIHVHIPDKGDSADDKLLLRSLVTVRVLAKVVVDTLFTATLHSKQSTPIYIYNYVHQSLTIFKNLHYCR